MHTLNQTVLLYKNLAMPKEGGKVDGFNLMTSDQVFLAGGLSFVHLTDITFVVLDNIWDTIGPSGRTTTHAFIQGTLKAALPKGLLPSYETADYLGSLPEIICSPTHFEGYYLSTTMEKLTSAREVYAFNNKLRVLT